MNDTSVGACVARGRDLIEYYLAIPQDEVMLPEDELAAIVDAVTDLLHLALRVMPRDPTGLEGFSGADYVVRTAQGHAYAESVRATGTGFVEWLAQRPQTGLPYSMGGPHSITCDLDDDCTCA